MYRDCANHVEQGRRTYKLKVFILFSKITTITNNEN